VCVKGDQTIGYLYGDERQNLFFFFEIFLAKMIKMSSFYISNG
jgi:hypothetical protein